MKILKKKYKNKISIPMISVLLFSVCILILSVGFSSFSSNLGISASAKVRVKRDIRVTNIGTSGAVADAYSNWEEYGVNTLSSSLALPNSNSSMTYDVAITNIGNVEMGILSITGLPSNLTYSISNYNLRDTLCDDTNTNQCKLGAVTTLHITISYAENGYNSSNINYVFDMNFEFKEAYSIVYNGFSSTNGLPTTILVDETKNVTFNNSSGIPLDVTVTGATSNYVSPNLTLSNPFENVIINRKFAVTYSGFPGNTSGLISSIGPGGGTITFDSTTGIPVLVTVTGATGSYNETTHVLSITNVTSDVTVTMENDGNVEIISVTRYAILNVTENSNPQITNNGQGITFDLGVSADQNNLNQDFYVTYAIVVNNDSVHEQKVMATNFTPNIVGSGNVPNVTYNITDTDGNPVINSTIAAKTSETYYLTINIEPQEQGSWGVDGTSGVDTVENGTISGSISGSNQGDLTGSNTTAHFTASVSNSYEEAKTFIFSIDDNKFRIVDSNGNPISSMNIAANTTATYDFYIENLNGNNFIVSQYDLNVNLNCDSVASSIGTVSLLVDVNPVLTDNTPPVINNVSATITSTQKEILVSFSGTDDNTISHFYVETYTSDASGNGTLYHTETLNGAANGAQVNYTATVPNDDAYYYFKVYAEDQSQNIASSNDINSCSTSSGHCSRTNNQKYKWNFEVKLRLTNASATGGSSSTNGNVTTVTYNVAYDGNMNTTLSGASNFDPPSSISSATITYADGTQTALQSGSSTQTAYSYNTTSHALNIYHIIGDITIEATGATPTCLAEGTKVLMADGSYKNVEDIGYDDLLAVWSYDTGKLTSTYPLWIEKKHITNKITRVTYSDDSYVDFVGNHAVYSMDKNEFVDITDKNNFKVGTNVAKLENNKLVSTTVKSIKMIKKKTSYYFVGSTTYYNIFANDILTTNHNLMISNLYGFEKNTKWPKEKAQIFTNKDNYLDYSYFKDVLPYYLYKGFRVSEAGYLINNNITTLDTFKTYISSIVISSDMIREPIIKNKSRYWMVTTSENIVNDLNKSDYLKKEGSIYVLPKSNKQNFIGWFNTSDNITYKPGDKITVNHGIHLKALYKSKQGDLNKNTLKLNNNYKLNIFNL